MCSPYMTVPSAPTCLWSGPPPEPAWYANFCGFSPFLRTIPNMPYVGLRFLKILHRRMCTTTARREKYLCPDSKTASYCGFGRCSARSCLWARRTSAGVIAMSRSTRPCRLSPCHVRYHWMSWWTSQPPITTSTITAQFLRTFFMQCSSTKLTYSRYRDEMLLKLPLHQGSIPVIPLPIFGSKMLQSAGVVSMSRGLWFPGYSIKARRMKFATYESADNPGIPRPSSCVLPGCFGTQRPAIFNAASSAVVSGSDSNSSTGRRRLLHARRFA